MFDKIECCVYVVQYSNILMEQAMDQLKIEGGARLEGTVEVSGAKNAALPEMCAALLAPIRLDLENAPDLQDVKTMAGLLGHMGARVERSGSMLSIDATAVDRPEAPYELVKTMRASILALGPLLARHGRAKVSLPGGCAIGERPVDQHIKGLRLMGADIEVADGYIHAKAKRLMGARIATDMPTVTGTENLLMAACLAKGSTRLENAAMEPEIVDLARLLRSMGARISGDGASVIEIEGVDELHAPLHAHRVMPDRIEAGTFLCAVAACGGDVFVKGAHAANLGALIEKLVECGADIRASESGIRVKMSARPKAVHVRTCEHPGFPTDMQAQFMAVACVAEGTSNVAETIFENRFMHVAELRRMGARIEVDGRVAVVDGIDALCGAQVMATDLRASACLAIAAMAAKGVTTIDRIYHLDRGYEGLERKLAGLGARIERVKARK